MNNHSKQEKQKKNNNPFFFCESKCGFCTVFRFFFSPFLFLSVATTSKLIKQEESLSLSLSRYLIGLDLCFPFHEFCFLVSLLVRVLLRVSRDLSMLFGSNVTHLFSLLFLYTELPPLRNLSSFFFLVLYFPLGFFSPYIVNDSFFLLSSISLSFTRATTPCFFLFAPRTPTPVKKKKVSFSFFLHTSQT